MSKTRPALANPAGIARRREERLSSGRTQECQSLRQEFFATSEPWGSSEAKKLPRAAMRLPSAVLSESIEAGDYSDQARENQGTLWVPPTSAGKVDAPERG